MKKIIQKVLATSLTSVIFLSNLTVLSAATSKTMITPETTKPEVAKSEVQVPEVVEPETTMPEVATESEVQAPEVVEPETTMPEVATEPEVQVPEVVEPENAIPEAIVEEVKAQTNVEETSTDVHEHKMYRPENGEWTELTPDTASREITITYKGCHCYVSFAEFLCDTSRCEGFNNSGLSEMMEGRRGECTITVVAPEAKDGYKFVGWKKTTSESNPNIDIYTAIYEAE